MSFMYGIQKGQTLFILFMLCTESVYMWLLGELFHRLWQKHECQADVTESYISFTASALKHSAKVACLLHKDQQAEFQQHLMLTGRLKNACGEVHNIITEGVGSWCRFRNTNRDS